MSLLKAAELERGLSLDLTPSTRSKFDPILPLSPILLLTLQLSIDNALMLPSLIGEFNFAVVAAVNIASNSLLLKLGEWRLCF